eukprot:m.576934 g.576934  ORF g.576934 m.576934 type:complete len:152 (+) comp22291_c1_seq2:1964-2419(+)
MSAVVAGSSAGTWMLSILATSGSIVPVAPTHHTHTHTHTHNHNHNHTHTQKCIKHVRVSLLRLLQTESPARRTQRQKTHAIHRALWPQTLHEKIQATEGVSGICTTTELGSTRMVCMSAPYVRLASASQPLAAAAMPSRTPTLVVSWHLMR